MNAEISWIYEVAVRPGKLDALKTLTAELVESAQTEPGVLGYQWSLSDDASVAHFSERYADSAATLSHLSMFRETFAQRFLAAVEPARLVVYGTPSEELKQALKPLEPVYMSAFAGIAR